MKLVVITPEAIDPREPAVLGALFAAGLERCHVRKPFASCEELTTWVRAVPAEFRARLVLHQHHDLVAELALRGCHWRDDAHASLISPADGGLTSRSCHDLATLRAALGRFDSVLVAPIFPSISKPGHGPRADFPPAKISELLATRTVMERHTAVIALGGITAENAPRCADLGFDGVAVLGAVWHAADPVRAFAQLQLSLACHAA
ncbi:MAG: thiamine phosphate synthase [Opitutaceae bacterium]|nr:thiamine phosphate synthase [Opitutaceae bacterium]